MKTQIITIRMLKDVSLSSSVSLPAHSLQTVELVKRGTNWIQVRLNAGNGRLKTLFNFDAVTHDPARALGGRGLCPQCNQWFNNVSLHQTHECSVKTQS